MTKFFLLILPLLFVSGLLSGQANLPATGKVSCSFSTTLDSIKPAVCAGTATGSAYISVSGATAPVLFFPNDTGPGLSGGNLTGMFAAGSQFVVVQDGTGCRDTVSFTISEPLAITLDTVITDANCNGDPDGAVSASATGGTGAITFAWQGCSGGAIVSNATATGLYAGCYTVTATDAKGCTATLSVTVGEPEPYVFNSSQDSVHCNGGADGSAVIEVDGGTPPYSFKWDNGDTAGLADGLNAGFHFVTITDAAGCIAATFVQVFEPPLFVVDSIVPVMPACFNGNDGKARVYASGGNKPYAYNWNDALMQMTQQATNLSAGFYTVALTDAKGCTAVASVTLNMPPDLTLSVASVSPEKCAGACDGAAMISAAGGGAPYNYLWDDPSLPDGTPSVSDLCPGTYMVTVQDFRGCTKTDKVTITPAVPFDLHVDAIAPACAGFADGSIVATIGGSSPPYQVLWSNGAAGPALSNLPCGNYVMTLTDNAGCMVIDTFPLPCPSAIVIDSIVVKGIQCFGEANGQISVYAHGGTGALTYHWNDPNMQASPVAANLPAGNYTVTVTDGNGCVVVRSAEVVQPQPLAVTASKTDVTCYGGNDGTASAEATGGTTPYDYAWNWTQNGSTITNLPAGNYIVTVIDAHGCTATAVTTVTQASTPVTIDLSQTRTACSGENNGEALAVATGGNGPAYTYQWSNGQTGISATGLPAGTLSVTAADSKGCSSVQSIEIQQFEKINANVIFVSPTCFNLSNGQAAINLVEGGSGMGDTTQYNYEWSVPHSSNSIYVNNLAGAKTYFVTVTDFQGCSGVFSFYVEPAPEIMIQAAVKNVSCFGLSDGAAAITGVQGAKLPVNYTWSSGETGPQIAGKPAGNYVLSTMDATGCTESDTIPITEPALLEISFEVQPLVCSYDSNAIITAIIAGGTPEYQLLWNTGANTVEINNLVSGIYTLNVVDKNGCTRADSVVVVRPDSLTIQTQKTDPQCFGGADGRLRLIVNNGQPPFHYNVNDGPFGGSSTFLGLKAGHYTFRVKDGKGCIAAVVDSLGQPPQVGVSLGTDTTITLGDSLLISADVFNAFGVVEYEWDSYLLENLPCVDTPECSVILVKPYQTNTYTVTVTDVNGCRGDALITVGVNKPRGVYVPSGFTPNADLNNDRLTVYGKSRQIRNVLVFSIYNRWGELVYQDKNFKVNDDARGWDGTFHGKDCDPGVYVWYVEVEYQDGYREALKGDVTLIR